MSSVQERASANGSLRSDRDHFESPVPSFLVFRSPEIRRPLFACTRTHAIRRKKNNDSRRCIERPNSSRSNHASRVPPFDFVARREDRLTRLLWLDIDYGTEKRQRAIAR